MTLQSSNSLKGTCESDNVNSTVGPSPTSFAMMMPSARTTRTATIALAVAALLITVIPACEGKTVGEPSSKWQQGLL